MYIYTYTIMCIYIYYHYSIKFPQIFKSTYDLKFSTKTRATKICHNLTRKSLLSQSAFPKLCRRMPILIEVVPVNPRKTGQDDSKNCMTGTSFIETPRCFFSIPWQKIATDHWMVKYYHVDILSNFMIPDTFLGCGDMFGSFRMSDLLHHQIKFGMTPPLEGIEMIGLWPIPLSNGNNWPQFILFFLFFDMLCTDDCPSSLNPPL